MTWTVPIATDNCTSDVTVSNTHNSGDTFAVGTTTVAYTFTDESGNVETCEFTVTVVDINDAPETEDLAITTPENTEISGKVTATDVDTADVLTFTIVTQPTNGNVVFNADGTFTYTPNGDYNGDDSFKYTVCDNGMPQECEDGTVSINVTPVNDAPTTPGLAIVTEENEPIDGTITATDIDGDVLKFTKVTDPTNGTVVVNEDGTFTYTPNKNYVGNDSFKYNVCDNGTPELCVEGTVTIKVTPVNDAPIISADDKTVKENFIGVVTVATATDVDNTQNELTYSIVDGLDGAQVNIDPATGAISFVTSPDYEYPTDTDGNNTYQLTVKVFDGDKESTKIITITVTDDVTLEDPNHDTDGDGVIDHEDNCVDTPNIDQLDTDGDGEGDVCDSDDDNDGLNDEDEDQGTDPKNPDTDNDGILDGDDNCPLTPNYGQEDIDNDGEGDACDSDDDNDGIYDEDEEDVDTDGDGIPNNKDFDSDNDGVNDGDDNCPLTYNPDQADEDGNGVGDSCEDAPDTFSPNGDGTNDLYIIPGILKHPNNKLIVFNRWGNEVYFAQPYRNDWDGKMKGKSEPLPSGTYFYLLKKDKNDKAEKGYIYITR